MSKLSHLITELRSARAEAVIACVALLLLLGSVAALAIWHAGNESEVRRELEQRSSVIAGLNDVRAQYYLAAVAVGYAALADDSSQPLEQVGGVTEPAVHTLERAQAELLSLREDEAAAGLEEFADDMAALETEAVSYASLTLNPDAGGSREMARLFYRDLWPEVRSQISNLEEISAEQQAKLSSERSAADASTRRNLLILIAFSSFALIAGVVSLLLLSVSVVRPLRSLQANVREIASGNLDARADASGPVEVASLARDFNQMVEARQRAEADLQKAREDLEVRVEKRTAALVAANRQLERLAKTDALTGLPNHRFLLEHLNREVDLALKDNSSVSMLMLDVDNFKQFNDTYGHTLGDGVLKMVAEVIRRMSENRGIAGRYGGDDFMIILPDTNKAAAREFSGIITAALGEAGFRARDGSLVPIGLSIGLACLPEDTASKDRLLAMADAAMYVAKRLGGEERNEYRLVSAGDAGDDAAFPTLDSLLQAIQYRDRYTKTHSDIVAKYAVELALRLEMSDQSIRALRIAGALHDVGKLIVPDEILKKPGALSSDEYEVIKRHPLVGEMLIRETPFLEDVIQAVGCHHERYDGTGYPRGLKGEEIPLLARILAIADAYSAMFLDRPYRKALTHDQIVAELQAGAGKAFDSRLVDAFIEILEGESAAQAA